jgi:hypothetical protein
MKNTLILSSSGLTPLTEQERRETTGGIVWSLVAVVTAVVLSAISNFQDIREGIVDGFNGTPRYPAN